MDVFTKPTDTTHDPSDACISLLSGGMDSLVTLAIAHQYHDPLKIFTLHLNYGQKTEQKELDCFHKISDFYKIPIHQRKIIDISFLKQIGGSSLTDDTITVKDYKGVDDEKIPDSYVPFRNTHIIAMAVSYAEVIGAKKIYIGAVFEDSSGYPDCRPSYYSAYNKLILEGTKEGVIKIITPVIYLKKKDIVLKAVELKAPIGLSWSCYKNNDAACGVCDSCALRLRGFKEANLKDPIPYQS